MELRVRLVRCVIGIVVGVGISLVFGMELVTWLSAPVVDAMREAGFTDAKMLARSIQEPFMVYMRITLVAGFVLASPYVFWELWQFVAVALEPRERRWVHIFAPVTVVLFLAGTAFAYFLAIRLGLRFLAGFAMELTQKGLPIDMRPGIADSVNLVLVFSVLMGLVFQLPLVILFLNAIGVFEVKSLKKFRRYFILVAFILGAVLTPSVDPITQTAMALPLILLYEAGLQASRILERRRARKLVG